MGRKVYATELPGEADIVIANAYSKANEALIAVQTGCKLLKKAGGDLVIIANIPEGQICHYSARRFGKTIGGRLGWPREELPPNTRRLIALGPYIDRAGIEWLGPPELVTIANSWSEIIDILKDGNSEKAKVVVIPDATIQYFPDRGEEKSSMGRFPDLAGEAI